MKYIALLRGINVGGKKKVPMSELKVCFEQNGFTNVKTLLNSGNVIFETSKINQKELTQEIEEMLFTYFHFEIPVLLRSMDEIHQLIKSNPFKKVEVTNEKRLYVTFLSEPPKKSISVSFIESGVRILDVTKDSVSFVVDLSKDKGTTDAMKLLEKEFGKNITTRNWNTVIKIGNLLS